MTFDYQPYIFVEYLKLPSEVGVRIKNFCEGEQPRDDTNAHFYLKILLSLSLSILEKHNVFSNIKELNYDQIEKLKEVFEEEIISFSKIYAKEREDVLNIIFGTLFDAVTILKLYKIFSGSEEKHKIIKRMVNNWVSNDLELKEYLTLYLKNLNTPTPQEIFLNYYQLSENKVGERYDH